MARRVIDGQISLFDAAKVEMRVVQATRTSSVMAQSAMPPSPRGKAFGGGEEARVLSLVELRGLEPFRAEVWIEERPWATQQVTKESEVYQFFQLFEAVFLTIGIPIGSERRFYHFRYTWRGVNQYNYCRVDEFYGREWRVWDKRPTDAQREATPWLSTR